MIFGKTKLELKVGIFVFLGLVVLVIFVLLIGNFKTWTGGYRVRFIFNFANGVKVGAPVRFAGADVGEVKELRFKFEPVEAKTKVNIICSVRKDIRIPKDSSVWVNTLGLLGEKYIEVMPGKDYKHIMLVDEELTGHDPIPMHEVAELLKNFTTELDEAIIKIKNKEGTIGKLLYDDKIYSDLEALVGDIRRHPWKLLWKTREKPVKK